MKIDENYRGRIRVQGKPGELKGYMLTVHDADTGEAIENVTDIELFLGVGHKSRAYLTYYSGKDDETKVTDIIADHDIALSALVEGVNANT